MTAGKKIEERLRQSETKFRALFENMTEGVALHEVIYNDKGRAVNYRIVDVNPAYETHTGLLPAMVRGKLATEVYGTEAAPYLPIWARVAETGVPHFMEVYFAPMKKTFSIASCSPGKGWFATVFTNITEKKRFEEQLIQSEDKFRSLVEMTSDWIWEVNEKGVCTYSSPRSKSLLGYDPAELVGKSTMDFVPPEDRKEFERINGEIFRNRKPYSSLQYRCRHKNGTILTLESSGMPIFDSNGWFRGYRGSDRDITERKRTEESLEKSRDLLSRTSRMAKIGGWELDVTALTQSWTEEMFDIFEIDPPRREPKVWEGVDFCAPASKPIGEQAVRRAIEHGEPYDIEVEIITAKGHRRWARSIGRPNYENGRVKSISGTFQDITERKRAEQALSESRVQLQCILESTADGILTVDARGKVIHSNRRFAEMWHIPQPILDTGDDPAILTAVLDQLKDPDVFLRKVKQLYASEAQDMDILFFKDGRIFERYSAPLMQGGSIAGRVWSFRDITVQKQTEESLQQLNRDLEQGVKNRTLQFELANRELEAFAYSVSHDLRAPLRSIDGFSMAILEDYSDKLDSEGRDHIQRLRRASQRMATLIDELLKLYRVTSGEIHIGNVNLSLLAANILSELQAEAPLRKAEIVIAPDVIVKADPHLMLTVMENLLNNAWKFASKKKKARIEFGVAKKDGATVYYVRDNGAGFDMSFVHKLFGVFQRLHSMEDFPGNGIGLASVQRVIHRHGGRIWAVGKPDNGAAFYFTLGSGIAETKEVSS